MSFAQMQPQALESWELAIRKVHAPVLQSEGVGALHSGRTASETLCVAFDSNWTLRQA